MSRTPFNTELYQITQVTPTMKEFRFRLLDGAKMKFEAGQFVMLQVPVEGKDKPVQRAYSIASSSEFDDKFDLIFKIVPGGIASTFVDKFKGGEKVAFTGPWGRCTFRQPPPQHVILASTSSGLSQHYSFLVSDAVKYPDVKYTVLVGVYRENEMFYVKELEALSKKLKNFELHWCLSDPSPNWKGFKGRITEFSKKVTIDPANTHIYLCGSDAMIKDMKQLYIEGKGLPKEHLCLENFG